jgi:L-Ala-D/L-Glu epimerase / N-acetyl-D-glutamate racemase
MRMLSNDERGGCNLRLTYELIPLQPRHDFNIARAAEPPVRRDVWVRITDGDGLEGWGEAAPSAYYHQSADTVSATLAEFAPVLEAQGNIEFADLPDLEDQIFARAPEHGSAAHAAVSAALLDLIGKREGVPVWRLLDAPVDRAPHSSFTIGIDDVDVMRSKVREASSYRILKVKVGTPDDERVLAMLREERPDAIVRVDANTGWSRREALHNLPMLEAFGVELIEQPLEPNDHAGLGELQRATTIPIIADESVLTAADIPKLVGCVSGINIKLSKCGSLLEAVRMVDLAREQGLQVMLGCMLETTLGIAAAVQIAGLVDFVDLDGAALLANDPFVGPGIEKDGSIRFNTSAGLGVRKAS